MEKAITFDAQGLLLEGRLDDCNNERGAIITHPHPLYGGDMNNAVVDAIGQAYQDMRWSTLRFKLCRAIHSPGLEQFKKVCKGDATRDLIGEKSL